MKRITPEDLLRWQGTIRWYALGVVKRQTFNTCTQVHQWVERETKEHPADDFDVMQTIVLPEGMVIGRPPLIGDGLLMPDEVTREEWL